MGVKKQDKKGKKKHKNKPTSKKYSKYKIDGDKIIRERSCPRCGPGIFLLNSQGRLYCGKCHYAEFASKKTGEVKDDKPVEESKK